MPCARRGKAVSDSAPRGACLSWVAHPPQPLLRDGGARKAPLIDLMPALTRAQAGPPSRDAVVRHLHVVHPPRASEKWQDTLLRDFLNREPVGPHTDRLQTLRALIVEGLADLPLPASGCTETRWRCLATVAGHDLSLLQLVEGHAQALATLAELGNAEPPPLSAWGFWAHDRVGSLRAQPQPDGGLLLEGRLPWCAGAMGLTHALVSAWTAHGAGPLLVAVDLAQPTIQREPPAWRTVGLAGAGCADVLFHGARGYAVGEPGDRISRPGHWHAAAGVAACWYGAAVALAQPLLQACQEHGGAPATRLSALGGIDVALNEARAMLREAAQWIDRHPGADASARALRARTAAEAAATQVLHEASRALGTAAFCRDAAWAQRAADLPHYLNQTRGEGDLAALGLRRAGAEGESWML